MSGDVATRLRELQKRVDALAEPILRDWGLVWDLGLAQNQTMNMTIEYHTEEWGTREEYIARMREHTRKYLL